MDISSVKTCVRQKQQKNKNNKYKYMGVDNYHDYRNGPNGALQIASD